MSWKLLGREDLYSLLHSHATRLRYGLDDGTRKAHAVAYFYMFHILDR